MTPRARTAKEEDAVRDRLVQSGRERFTRYGLNKVSIDELVSDARISKGSFYKFFDSKEHLFAEIFAIVNEEVFVGYAEAIERAGDDPREILTEFFSYPYRNIHEWPFLQEVFRPGVMEQVMERTGAPAAGERPVNERIIDEWLTTWIERGVVSSSVTMGDLVGMHTVLTLAMRAPHLFDGRYEPTMELVVDCFVTGLLNR